MAGRSKNSSPTNAPDTPFKLAAGSNGDPAYRKNADGSIVLNMQIDKDQVECPICYKQMTESIFKCSKKRGKAHNICGACEWELRRMKNENGHTKPVTCPLCKTEGIFSRNPTLEAQLKEVSQPCKNKDSGCKARFFPWDEELHRVHCKGAFSAQDQTMCIKPLCMFTSVRCSFCEGSIAGGAGNFVQHLLGSDDTGDANMTSCSKSGSFAVKDICQDSNKHTFFELDNESTLAVNENGGYAVMFVKQGNQPVWKVTVVATAPELGLTGNDVLHLQWTGGKAYEEFDNAQSRTARPGSKGFIAPTVHGMSVPVSRLLAEWEGECKEQCELQAGYIYQPTDEALPLRVRMWTLAESLKIGSVIDARDFTGKWYEAEIIAISKKGDPASKSRSTDLTPLQGRLFQVHYLGYSINYDEWLNLDTDSNRIAHRGTYTVGPNLRAKRRNNQLQQDRLQERRVHRDVMSPEQIPRVFPRT